MANIPPIREPLALKRYVAVTVRHDEDGRCRPLQIIWDDGRAFHIDQVLDVHRRASRKAGGTGICYKIRIGEHITHLYQEEERWFVEADPSIAPTLNPK